jgi:hypothetical protein
MNYSGIQQSSLAKADTYAILLYRSAPHLYQQADVLLSKTIAVSTALRFTTRRLSRISDAKPFERALHLAAICEKALIIQTGTSLVIFRNFSFVSLLIEE